jgi:hypothetical protein
MKRKALLQYAHAAAAANLLLKRGVGMCCSDARMAVTMLCGFEFCCTSQCGALHCDVLSSSCPSCFAGTPVEPELFFGLA